MKDFNMNKIEYIEIDKKDLDIVRLLWGKLKEHHKIRSRYFQKHFDRMTWKKRKSELLNKCRKGAMFIHLAKDSQTGVLIGYCISTINEKKQGEIDSIFIEEGYRRQAIGDNFMKRAVEWMERQSITRRVIAVVAGNEETFGFYSKYQFYPRVTILEQVKTK